MLGQIFWRPDIVLTIEPPFFNAPIALLVARLSGAKSILHIQDLEIDAAFGLGLLKGGTIKRFSFFCERKLLSYFDLISTISKSMLSKIVEKGIPREAIYYFPNWADTSHFSKKSQREFRDYLQIPDDYIVALYSGNMGAKQGLELLSAVVKLYSSRPKDEVNIIFIFCGNGPSRLALEKSCSEFDFVRFIDLQPADRFADFLKMADIHLLPQRSNVEDLVMPSKLTGMLASGRPVIATAVEGSELAEVVSGCGLAVPPNDPELFYEALVILAKDAPLRKRLGEAGEAYALNFLSMDSILYDFELKLKNRLRSH
jgi:colanic acid biosynthesis glycosyl transferase WcaI